MRNAALGMGKQKCLRWKTIGVRRMNLLRYKLRFLLVLTALVALATLWLKDWFINSYGTNALFAPIQTTISRHPTGDLTSTRRTYSVGNYGISEFGNIRLAIEGKPFSRRPPPPGFVFLRMCRATASKFNGRSLSRGDRQRAIHPQIHRWWYCLYVWRAIVRNRKWQTKVARRFFSGRWHSEGDRG